MIPERLKNLKDGETQDAICVEALAISCGGVPILSELSCAFSAGQWTHILGPNGAGKSTLLKAMACLWKPDVGRIAFLGQALEEMTVEKRARMLSYVPQRLESWPSMSASDLVDQGSYLDMTFREATRLSWGRRKTARCHEALALFGVSHLAERRLDSLSGGERQLVLLASSFAQGAKAVLLDEPLTGLDLRHIAEVAKILRAMVACGKTIISVSHDLRFAAETGDAYLLLSKGRVVYQGSAFASPQALSEAYDMEAADFEALQGLGQASEKTCDPEVLKRVKSFLALSSQDKGINAQYPSQESLDVLEGSCGERNDLLPTSNANDTTDEQLANPRRSALFLSLLLVGLFLFLPLIGASGFLYDWDSDLSRSILLNLRIPRVLWGAIAGASLAIVGAVLQTMLQNPLATPYTMGLASGASLGAMSAIQLGFTQLWVLPLSAFTGSTGVMAAVLSISGRIGLRNPMVILLAGVMASMFCSALGLVIQAFATPLTAQQMLRWQLGGLEIVGYQTFILLPIILMSLFILWRLAQALNLVSVDSDLATTRGVQVEHTRRMAFIFASLATAIVVAICGPISFIGLLIPHWLRQRHGSDLRLLIPLCALAGASFLICADSLSRVIEAQAYLPVGVITALLGAPLFLLASRRGQSRNNEQKP